MEVVGVVGVMRVAVGGLAATALGLVERGSPVLQWKCKMVFS